MSIGLTDDIAPLGDFAILQDIFLRGGLHTVTTLVERDAITALRRKAGMLVWVEDEGIYYKLGAGLANVDWEEFRVSASTVVVYLSSTGDDADDGSLGNPVATWARTWSLLQGSSPGVVFLSGSVSGYTAPPASLPWVIISGGSDFTTVATGSAGAGTTLNKLELAVSASIDGYRHKTVVFDDGAAAGFRRTIRGNSLTICDYVHPVETNLGATSSPAPGDTYRVVEPTAKIGISTAQTGYRSISLTEGQTRLDLINVALVPPATGSWYQNTIKPPTYGEWFGVQVENNWNINASLGRLVCGVDDVNTHNNVLFLTTVLGETYTYGQWHGWGLSFKSATFLSSNPNPVGLITPSEPTTLEDNSFLGFITCQTMQAARAIILGGSAQSFSQRASTQSALISRSLTLGNSVDAVPFLLKSDVANVLELKAGSSIFFHETLSSTDLGLEIKSTAGSGDLIKVAKGASLYLECGVSVAHTGGSVVLLDNKGAVKYNSGTAFLWSVPGSTAFKSYDGSLLSLAALDVDCAVGFDNDCGSITIEAGTSQVDCTAALLVQNNGAFKVKGDLTATGDAADMISIVGGNFVQAAGTLSATNANTGTANVLRCSLSGSVSLLGGAATTLDGSAAAAGYGLNARLGGRVFTAAQLTGATGATADLTVAAGYDKPDSFVGTYGALVSPDGLSVIALSAGGPDAPRTGGGGWVRVVDIQMQGAGTVYEPVYSDAAQTVIQSTKASNEFIQLDIECSYPNIRIGITLYELARVGDIYSGTINLTVGASGVTNLIVQSLNSDGLEGAVDRVDIEVVPPPTILTLAFADQGGGAGGVGTYPGSQTELKAGDTIRVEGTTNTPADAIQCTDVGACGSQIVTFASGTSFSVLVTIANRGLSVQSLFARLSARGTVSQAYGPTRDTNNGGGTTDGVNLVKLNNLYPTIDGLTGAGTVTGRAFAIAYPASQSALKDAETAAITAAASNYDIISYSAPGAEVSIPSPSVFASPKVVTRVGGTYNVSTDNYQIVATRNANAAVKTVSGVVAIAHVNQVITVSVPFARLRSGGNNGTAAQDYTVTISSNQQLFSAPSVAPEAGGNKGTFQGGAFAGGPSSWTRTFRISETVPDLKGTFTWASLSTTNRAGKVVSTITTGPTYTLGGFVARTLVFSTPFGPNTTLGTEVVTFSKLTAGTFTATSSPALKQTIGTSPPVINGYTIDAVSVNPTTVVWLDTGAVNSNSSGTAAITTVEEIV